MIAPGNPDDTGPGGHAGRAERVARQTGRQVTELTALGFDLSTIDEKGVFLAVRTSGFNRFFRQLDWSALGVTLPKGDVAFRAPSVALLPDRFRLPLMRAPDAAHRALDRYSYRLRLTEVILRRADFRWVPARAFLAFEAEFNTRARDALAAAQAALLAEYWAVREEMVGVFRATAEGAVPRIRASGGSVPDGFVGRVVDDLLAAMPGEAEIEGDLEVGFDVGVLHLGSEMLAEQRKSAELRRRLETEEAAHAEAMADHRKRQRAEQLEFFAEEERLRRRLAQEAQEAQREAEAAEKIRQLKIRAEADALKAVVNPLVEMGQQLHAIAHDTVVAILEPTRRSGKLHGSSAKALRDMIRRVEMMNWQDDEKLAELTAELKMLVNAPTGRRRKRDAGPIADKLDEIRLYTAVQARHFLEPSQMEALEL